MSTVVARRAQAIALIKAGKIASQSDLVKELKKSGFAVTQTTASRDLDEIGAVRGRNGYTIAESDDDSISAAIDAGVSSYVVDGLAPHRIRPACRADRLLVRERRALPRAVVGRELDV